MTKEKDIEGILKTVSTNKKAFIVFVIVAVLAGVFLIGKYFTPQETTSECDFIKEQNREYFKFILDTRRNIKEIIGEPTSYIESKLSSYVIFASVLDTVPHNQEQQRLKMILKGFDSLLIKRRLDSLKRAKKG